MSEQKYNMKYVVNQRGGAKQVADQQLNFLMAQGYIEITKKQFEDKKYYPEYDQGVNYKESTTPQSQIQTQEVQSQTSRESFKTRIV